MAILCALSVRLNLEAASAHLSYGISVDWFKQKSQAMIYNHCLTLRYIAGKHKLNRWLDCDRSRIVDCYYINLFINYGGRGNMVVCRQIDQMFEIVAAQITSVNKVFIFFGQRDAVRYDLCEQLNVLSSVPFGYVTCVEHCIRAYGVMCVPVRLDKFSWDATLECQLCSVQKPRPLGDHKIYIYLSHK